MSRAPFLATAATAALLAPAAAAFPSPGPALANPAAPGLAAAHAIPAAPGLAATPAAPAAPGRPGAPSPVDLVGLDFQLINAQNRSCLAQTRAGLMQQRCSTADSHRWRFAPDTPGFRFVHVGTERCLSTAGRAVTLAPCDSAPARRWTLVDGKGETAQVRNTATRHCLAPGRGGRAAQTTCGDYNPRRWTVRLLQIPLPFTGAGNPR